MYIDIEALAIFILVSLAVIISVFLVITLKNLNSLLKKFNKIVESNTENINKTINILPDTMSNLNEAAVSMKGTLDKAGSVIGTIDGAVTDTVVSVSDTTETVFEIVKVIGLIAKYISSAFRHDDDD
jgi:predicted PurR-regulated permease PerM